jgi:hypothetical protein
MTFALERPTMMNAYDYLKSLVEDGYFDDLNQNNPTGLRRLLAASSALLHADASEETISPSQQDELVRLWNARQLKLQPAEV